MCLIDVPNLKEIDLWEGYFYVVVTVIFMHFKNCFKAV